MTKGLQELRKQWRLGPLTKISIVLAAMSGLVFVFLLGAILSYFLGFIPIVQYDGLSVLEYLPVGFMLLALSMILKATAQYWPERALNVKTAESR